VALPHAPEHEPQGQLLGHAVAESFFATLKKELIRDCQYDTRAGARTEVFEYIEVFYNRQRTHSLLGYVTPEAFEDGIENRDVA
jgi:putative transposase